MAQKSILTAAALLLLHSCHQGLPPHSETELNPLIIENIRLNRTKAPYTASYLAGDFGIILEDSSGDNAYDGISYNNVKFTANEDGSCSSEREVRLSTTEGHLYSYYPYSEQITDLRNIPIDITSDATVDYLYGTPVAGIDNINNAIGITMNHALAAINISLARGRYSGPGVISRISIRSEGIAGKAVLDATTGILSGFSDISAEIGINADQKNLSYEALDNQFIIIPTGDMRPIDIEVVIDGVEFLATTTPAELKAGTITGFAVTVHSDSIVIQTYDIPQWIEEEGGDYILEKE